MSSMSLVPPVHPSFKGFEQCLCSDLWKIVTDYMLEGEILSFLALAGESPEKNLQRLDKELKALCAPLPKPDSTEAEKKQIEQRMWKIEQLAFRCRAFGNVLNLIHPGFKEEDCANLRWIEENISSYGTFGVAGSSGIGRMFDPIVLEGYGAEGKFVPHKKNLSSVVVLDYAAHPFRVPVRATAGVYWRPNDKEWRELQEGHLSASFKELAPFLPNVERIGLLYQHPKHYWHGGYDQTVFPKLQAIDVYGSQLVSGLSQDGYPFSHTHQYSQIHESLDDSGAENDPVLTLKQRDFPLSRCCSTVSCEDLLPRGQPSSVLGAKPRWMIHPAREIVLVVNGECKDHFSCRSTFWRMFHDRNIYRVLESLDLSQSSISSGILSEWINWAELPNRVKVIFPESEK